MKVVRIKADFYGLGAETRRRLDSYPWRGDQRRIRLFMSERDDTWFALDAILDCSYSIGMLD